MCALILKHFHNSFGHPVFFYAQTVHRTPFVVS